MLRLSIVAAHQGTSEDICFLGILLGVAQHCRSGEECQARPRGCS